MILTLVAGQKKKEKKRDFLEFKQGIKIVNLLHG